MSVSVVPYSEEFEKAIIVSTLSDPLLLPKVQALLDPDDFYLRAHRDIWRAIVSLEPDQVDSLAVNDKLRTDTQPYFKELVEDSDKILPSISNALFYAETIRQKSKLRAGIELGQNIISLCYQEADADEANHQLESLFAKFLQQQIIENKVGSTQSSFKEFLDSLRDRKPDDPTAIKTGYRDIDLMVQKLEELVILAAKTGMGKTSYALNVVMNVARTFPVLYFSLEQTEKQLFERMLAIEAEIPLEEIRLGIYDQDKLDAAQKRMEYLIQNIYIDDKANVPSSYITSVARQKKFELGKIGMIVVDYLHIMKLNDKNQVEALGDAANELRGLAKELDCPVLLLCQLSRGNQERRSNHRPELSDLRGSGALEQLSDLVLFIHRESYYDEAGMAPDQDIAEIVVRKNRNGRTGIVPLTWYPKIQKFTD